MADMAILAFTTKEAQRLTGLTPRRLQYWDETGFITPSVAASQGRGLPRLYSFQDLVQLRIAAQLRDRLSLQALRRLQAALDLDAPLAVVRFAITAGGETVDLAGSDMPDGARAPGQIVETFQVPLEEIRVDLQLRAANLQARVGDVVGTQGVMAHHRHARRGDPCRGAAMISATADPRLLEVAARLFWWKLPAEALADERRFLAQAMTFGSWDDVAVVSATFPDPALQAVLADAPPGVFDQRSWAYWHARFGLLPVPPLPRRRL